MIRRILSFTSIGVFAVSVFAEEADTAYVPFVVNVDAKVTAQKQGADPVSIDVTAGEEKTLEIPLEKANSIIQSMRNGQSRAPLLSSNNHGKVSLNLPSQSYNNAEISLYSINGKRILRGKADASQAVKNISRPNLVAGVYLLSVKGTNGQSFSNRLTHRGGSLNISVSFGVSENFLTDLPVAIAKSAAESDGWTITVSADGYVDFSYTFIPVKGMNDVQNITLGSQFNPEVDYGSFMDTRGGKSQSYRTVVIGGKTWMAENLNYDTLNGTGSWCYNCNKYGRLYNWNTAMGGASSSIVNPSGVQGVCPDDWHLPSRSEWDNLVTAVGGSSTAGNKLKSQTGWNSGGNGTDDYGFSALPGGNRKYSDGEFYNAGSYGFWWGATEDNSGLAYNRNMTSSNNNVYEYYSSKDNVYSVRCLRDN